MYVIYIDDSGSTGKNLADRDQPFQVVCGVIVKDELFSQLELYFSILTDYLPEKIQGKFTEFHALDMLQGSDAFEGLSTVEALGMLGHCLAIVPAEGIPVIYGAVDKKKLSEQVYSSADPIDMSFRLCMEGVEKWFEQNAPHDLGIVIADDGNWKSRVHNAFRQYRRQVLLSDHNRGRLEHLHDDMYFGESKHSKGIQLADMCGIAVARHLAGKPGSEELYVTIKENIVFSKVEPE